MNKKSLLLLLIFSASLFPVYPVSAGVIPIRTVEEAVLFMYISDAILTPENEIDDSQVITGLSSLVFLGAADVDTNPLLARIIHTKKMQRNDLDANCRLLKSYYQGQGKDCEVNEVTKYCQTKRDEINAQIGFYHKMRGDQRKFFTKMWHSIKQNSSNFWHKIGPVGRNFLRNMGQEALQIVVSGGTLGGDTIKNLIKNQARSMGRERIRQVVFQGVQKLLQGQMEIAAAAGVDICNEDGDKISTQGENANITLEPGAYLNIQKYWICTSTIGAWGAWMQSGETETLVDKSDLVFDLDASDPSPGYEFSFHGIARIPLYGASGDFYDYALAEEQSSGTGKAEWDVMNYFYGTVDIKRTSLLTYPSSETTEQSDEWQRAVIGALSPDQQKIHICIHEHTKEQFDSIKKQPFENLLPNCASKNYFICKPK